MRRSLAPLMLSLMILLVLPAPTVQAEQVIHFTNGTTMPIRSHTIQGTMIHCDLGGDAFIAFPVEQVDRVVEAGRNVMLDPSFKNGNRIVVDTTAGSEASYPVRAVAPGGSRAEELRRAREALPVEVDPATGQAYQRPAAGSIHPGRARLGRAVARPGMGRRSGPDSYEGATRVGNRHVIGGETRSRTGDKKPPITTMAPTTRQTSKSH